MESWSIGFVLMGMYFRVFSLLAIDEMEELRRNLDQIMRNEVNAWNVFQKLVFPVLYQLGLFNMIPYVISYGILPNLFHLTIHENAVIGRLAYPMTAMLFVSVLIWRMVHRIWNFAHQRLLELNNEVEQQLQNVEH